MRRTNMRHVTAYRIHFPIAISIIHKLNASDMCATVRARKKLLVDFIALHPWPDVISRVPRHASAMRARVSGCQHQRKSHK